MMNIAPKISPCSNDDNKQHGIETRNKITSLIEAASLVEAELLTPEHAVDLMRPRRTIGRKILEVIKAFIDPMD